MISPSVRGAFGNSGCKNVAVADEVLEFLLGELTREDDFNTTAAEIARLHDGFVFFFEGVSKFFVATNLHGVDTQH